jgi:hypothetical protein
VTQRFYSGHESWVFQAHAVDELCGHHAGLVGGALRPGERPDYLLYSPLREIAAGPFGLERTRGSHAIAVTSDRFIVSRDPHRATQTPVVRDIPFSSVLAVELGEALTLGWLVVRFVADGRATSETICFQSSGIDHFRAAARAWRARADSASAPGAAPAPASAPAPEDDERAPGPSYLRHQVSPLLLSGERACVALHAGEVWRPDTARRRSACVSREISCVVTDRALVVAQSEAPPRRGTLVFAVNVTLIDRRAIRDVAVRTERGPAPAVTSAAIVVERKGVRRQLDLALGQLPPPSAEALATELLRRPGPTSP